MCVFSRDGVHGHWSLMRVGTEHNYGLGPPEENIHIPGMELIIMVESPGFILYFNAHFPVGYC